MSSDERSPGEQYPGPEPAKSTGKPPDAADAADAAPAEHGRGRGRGGPAHGADETVEAGDAVASFGPRLGRAKDAQGSYDKGEDRDSPAKTDGPD
jgi:hypothetical protein